MNIKEKFQKIIIVKKVLLFLFLIFIIPIKLFSTEVVIFSDTFSNADWTPPAGWTLYSDGSVNWTSYSATAFHGWDTVYQFAYIESTQTFALNGYDAAQISYYYYIYATAANNQLRFEEYYSGAWHVVRDVVNMPGLGGWSNTFTDNINLNTTKIRFSGRVADNGGSQRIDNVVITVTATPDIKGYAKDPLNGAMQNVKVDLTGTETRTTYTNSSGYYEFLNTTYNGNYTVTPSSFAYYSFTPVNRSYTNLIADQSNQDYTRNNTTPTLAWTGEAGYTSDGVNPDYGDSITNFAWRIKYTDSENDAPASGYPKVHIKKGGVEISGSPFTMSYVSGNYNTGAIYSYSKTLTEGDDYTYYFEANDTWGAYISNGVTAGPVSLKPNITGYVKDPAGIGMQNVKVQLTGTETWTQYTTSSGYYDFVDMTYNGNYTVTPSSFAYYSFTPANRSYTNLIADQSNQDYTRNNNTNTAALSWLGTANYVSDGVDPEMGSTTTVFTYKINYADPENDAPKSGYPKVHIKKGWPVGSDIAGSPFTMTAEVPGDINYMDGKIYSYSTTLSTGVDFTYYFETYDIWNTSSTAPLEVNAPDVSNQPLLVWTGEPGYESDGINPEIGTSTVTFMYRITYKDPEADQPKAGYPKVHIKHGDVEISGSPFTMSYVSGNYDTGAIYKYEITLSTGIDYNYNFEAYDIWDAAAIPPSTMTGPQVKTIINGYAKDLFATGMQNVKMTLSGDEANTYYTNSSGYYEFWITTMSYTVTPSSFAYYSFAPPNRSYANTQTNQTDQNFVRTSTSPILSWTGETGYETDGIEPKSSTYTTTTTYKIKYTDADNDAPASGYPKVVISSGGVTIKTLSMNYESGNYLTGAIYSISVLLTPCSYYEYSFQANDCWNAVSTSTLSGAGPTNLVSLVGYCYYPDNTVMRDITITLTDSENNSISTTTNSSGYYQFIGLTPGLDYVAVPSSFTYYSFTPANRTYTNLITDQSNQNFMRNNAIPTIAWTGEGGYTTDGVNPDSGSGITNFDWRIKYTDSDNDAPDSGYPKVHIKKGEVEISGSPFTMNYVSGNYNTGAIYSYTRTLTEGDDYTYYFETKDIWNASTSNSSTAGPVSLKPDISGYVKDPLNGAMQNVKVNLTGTETLTTYTNSMGYYEFLNTTYNNDYTITPSSFVYYSFTPSSRTYIKNITPAQNEQNFARNNTVPALTFTNEENYKTSSVYPTTGTPNTDNFAFRILYTDIENDPPSDGCRLHIINNGKEITGSPFTMIPDSSEYRYGKTYSYTSTFSYTGSNYSYYYEIKGFWNDNVKTSSESFCVSSPPLEAENISEDATDGGTVVSSEIILRWAATDPDNDNVIYRLYISEPQTEGNYNLAIKKATVNMTLKYEGQNNYYVIKNAIPGKTYFWRVDTIDSFGVTTESKTFSFKTLDIPTSKIFNYPNPFNPNNQKTRIVYKVNSDQTVKIKIYSEYGNIVYDTETNAVSGTNEFYYDGKDNNGNILYNDSYICRVEKAEGTNTCYLLIIK